MAKFRTDTFQVLVGTLTENDEGEEVVDGLRFGFSSDTIQIKNVEGLETAPIRNNSGDWSGRDGGYMSSQLYSARQITINGFYWDPDAGCAIVDPDRTEILSVREKLTNMLAIRKLYPIFIKFATGRCFYTEGYMIDFRMPYDNYIYGDFTVTFYCPDFALALCSTFGDKNSVWRQETLFREDLGGHLVPELLPVLFESGQHATIIEYKGLIESYPKIILRGPATNPAFINTATNMFFQMGDDEHPFSIVAGQTLVIDMQNRQATVGGKSVSMSINPDSQWWYLTTGSNRIYYVSDYSSDNDQAIIRFKDLFQGA